MRVSSLKELRLNKNISPEEASKKLGISISYLFYLESGKRNPSDKLKVKLAELYGVSKTTIFLITQSTKRVTD